MVDDDLWMRRRKEKRREEKNAGGGRCSVTCELWPVGIFYCFSGSGLVRSGLAAEGLDNKKYRPGTGPTVSRHSHGGVLEESAV